MKNTSITFEDLPSAVSSLREDVKWIKEHLLSEQEDAPLSPKSNKFLTIHEASQFLGLARQTIYGLVCRKQIPVMKQGKRLYFSRADLINWIEAGRKPTRSEIAETSRPTLIKRTSTSKTPLK